MQWVLSALTGLGRCSLNTPGCHPCTLMHCPGVPKRLSSGPCKPRRPLLMLQPNGHANLPFMCHRRNPPQTAPVCFGFEQSRRRTQACSGTKVDRRACLLVLPAPLLHSLKIPIVFRGECELSGETAVHAALAHETRCELAFLPPKQRQWHCVCMHACMYMHRRCHLGMKTDLECGKGSPPSVPYLWIARIVDNYASAV